ncbi:Kv channel-interacting protein 1-like [Topomyia yanbarensis]|uniref:Kv channel-interacting protein 1-like n=1 Tax=Topomyia yanbarensis TaxID=2498891 RepID=UPI00273BFFAA|nr:Kv channel-interacting protein 1-like [Topomyia yanbarensis]XP_058815554.1 Kv channel-interacting protein 1-like [Topomyia yanbarensis]XP_058815556.1 Kv channel-interacting protein 1-like [Topomyia yanbarensis]XP_058815557.1 Kv channel-interacting protein 1-like [Topomyia yanbarensis]
MASLVQPSHSQQVVQSQQIAIEIASEPVPAPQQQQQQQQHQHQLQIHHQELQAHALLAQCQQPQSLPTPTVDIVLRESTRANLISRKKTSVSGDKRGGGGGGGRSSGRDDKGEGKSVYRKFFKRIKTILDGNDPTAKSKPEAEDLPVPQRYYPDSLGELTRTARFTEDEIKRIYRGFKAECPTGIVKEETFKGIYSQFFPLGAASGQYAHYVFNSIDLDRNGSLSFEEFVANLSILLRGTVDEKLQWTFALYDINGDGCITKEEMKEIVTAIYELMGKVPEGCEEEQAIKEKVERLFEKMDRNCDGKITLDEFIECCTTDESIRRSIAVFDTIF